jgi:hypothetical protein
MPKQNKFQLRRWVSMLPRQLAGMERGGIATFLGLRSDPTFIVMYFWGGADVFCYKVTASAA